MSERITAALAREVVEELERDVLVDRTLMPWGRLRVEGMLPFLCVYRRPVGVWDHGTAELLTTQPSYLLAPGDDRSTPAVLELVETLVPAMRDACGALLLLEIWSGNPQGPSLGEGRRAEPSSMAPTFRVHVPDEHHALALGRFLERALGRVHSGGQEAHAETCREEDDRQPGPPGMPGLVSALRNTDEDGRLVVVGLEVAPVFRELETGELFPFLLDELRRGLAPILTESVSEFVSTSSRAEEVEAGAGSLPTLARRTLESAAIAVDRKLSELAGRYDLLLEVTPVDSRTCWEKFDASGCEKPPDFHYRPLRFHPSRLKRELFSLPVDDVEEPLLARLFREKQEEVDRHLTMLMDRGTRNFFFTSQQLYGELPGELLDLAETILERIPPSDPGWEDSQRMLEDRDIVLAAQPHLDAYREACPAFPSQADLWSDIPPGLIVSRGRLLVGEGTQISERRIEALMHHEIGTHMITYHNGAEQPLQLLKVGLAGYESLQEALAVLAEYLAGGLTNARVRTLAARVVTVRALIEGADFVEAHRMLRREYGYSPADAYTVTMRVYRGGGLTKDMVYLQGLVELGRAIRGGIELESFFIGKLSLERFDDVRELRGRGVLESARVRPRFLELEGAEEHLERLREGDSMLELIEQEVRKVHS